jgi:hypothetical protein
MESTRAAPGRPRLEQTLELCRELYNAAFQDRVMRRFKSAGNAQRFLSAFGIISQHFRPRRDLLKAKSYREEIDLRFVTWREMTCSLNQTDG